MKVSIDSFILVHGTFARDADWVHQASPICCALKEAFRESTIERFEWAGDNLQPTRESEARRLRNFLLSLGGDPDNPRRMAVIAHSHGGNLAVGAIRGQTPIPGLACVVCLATPFLRFSALPIQAPLKILEDFFSLWPLYFIAAYRGHDPFVDLACVNASFIGHGIATLCMYSLVFLTAMLNSLARGGLSLFVRRGMKVATTTSARPRIPLLAVTHRYDEAFVYLRCHDFLTRLPRLMRWAPLSACVLFTVAAFRNTMEGRYCYDVIMRIGWGALSIPKAALAGLYAGAFIVELWIGVAILSLLVETFWACVVTVLLHVARGSIALGSGIKALRLPQQLQIGFGETFRQTWVGSVSISRLPEDFDHATLFRMSYPRRGRLLHAAIYSDPNVIRAVLEFIGSPSLPAAPAPKSVAAKLPEPAAKSPAVKPRRFQTLRRQTIFLAVIIVAAIAALTTRLYLASSDDPLAEIKRQTAILQRFNKERDAPEAREDRRKMDDVARMDMQEKARERAIEISVHLRMTPEEFVTYFRNLEKEGKRNRETDMAWAKLLNGLHVPMRTDVTEADFESVDITGQTVGAFLKMKRTPAVDDLAISVLELAEIESHWTLRERRNFAWVFVRASEITSEGGRGTQQEAYVRSLREFAKKVLGCPRSAKTPVGPDFRQFHRDLAAAIVEGDTGSRKASAFFAHMAGKADLHPLQMLMASAGNSACFEKALRKKR